MNADWSLDSSSVCINAGAKDRYENGYSIFLDDPSYVADFSVDYARNARIVEDIDMGAFEYPIIHVEDPNLFQALKSVEVKYKIYPSSTSQYVYIESASHILEYQVRVITLKGETIFMKSHQKGDSRLDLLSLSEGIYLIQIIGQDRQMDTFKIFKE